MLFQNALIENSATPTAFRVENGKFAAIGPDLTPNPGEEVVDLQGKLVLPPFIESHVHLDTCLTAGDPVWNMSGTLFEGIECWSKRKEKLSKDDIKERVNRAVRLYAAHGIQHIRTHVDVTDPSLVAMETMVELREELRDLIAEHVQATGSERGRAILADFEYSAANFKRILPRDYAKMLEAIAQCEGQGMGRDEAELEAFYAATGGAN